MDFDQDKRCAFVERVFVEGARPSNGEFVGIDRKGRAIAFDATATAKGRAAFVRDVIAERDDDGDLIYSQGAVFDLAVDPEGKGYAYQLDLPAGKVYIEIESGVRTMWLKPFLQQAYRADEEGRLVVSFWQPEERQYSACSEAGLFAHVDEIDQIFAAMKDEGDISKQMRGFFHDLRKSEGDGRNFEEIYQMVYLEDRTPMHERFSLDEATGQKWLRVIDHPAFQDSRVRAALEYFLKDRIGNFPVEEISCTMFDSLAVADLALTPAFRTRSTTKPFEGGERMPRYKTSEVLEYAGAGMTVIAFTDMTGAGYAYGYPTRRALNLAHSKPDIGGPKI